MRNEMPDEIRRQHHMAALKPEGKSICWIAETYGACERAQRGDGMYNCLEIVGGSESEDDDGGGW